MSLAAACGTAMTTYNGQVAYSNGPDQGTGRCCGGDISTGCAYQCVEYVQRYFHNLHGVQPIWPVAYAKQMCSSHPSDVTTTNYPKPGDAVVFNWAGSEYGHTAIFVSVGLALPPLHSRVVRTVRSARHCTIPNGTFVLHGRGCTDSKLQCVALVVVTVLFSEHAETLPTLLTLRNCGDGCVRRFQTALCTLWRKTRAQQGSALGRLPPWSATSAIAGSQLSDPGLLCAKFLRLKFLRLTRTAANKTSSCWCALASEGWTQSTVNQHAQENVQQCMRAVVESISSLIDPDRI